MGSKSKSSQETTFDPELKGAALGTYRAGQRVAALPYAPYDAATVAPMSPFQLEGMNRTVDVARAGMGQPQVQAAMNAAQNVAQFQPGQVTQQNVNTQFNPSQVQGQGVTATQMGMDRIGPLGQVGGVNAQQVGMANAVPTQNVQADRINAGQFSQTDMNPYMNQYQQGVIDPALRDIERARQMQQNQNAASAVSAGAFGGSRQGLVEAETNRAALQRSADTAARLRQQGFESGAQRMQNDLNRSLAADTSSAQLGLQGDLANQRAGLQSGLAAQGQNTQRMLANQSADLRGQQLSQLAQQQNVQNDLARQRANQGTRSQMEQAQMRGNLAADTTTANNMMRAQQLNQAAGLQAMGMGSQAEQANMQAALRAGMANQQAGLQGAAQNLAGTGMLGNLANQYRGMNFGDAQAITGVGQQQRQVGQQMLDDQYRRYLDARNFPLQMFDVLRGATGMLPSPVMQSGSSRSFGIG